MSKCLTPDELKSKADEYVKTLADAGITTFPEQIRYFVEKGERTKQQLALLSPYIKEAYNKLGLADPKSVEDFNIATHIKTISDLQKADRRIAKDVPQSTPVSEPTARWMGNTLKNVGLDGIGDAAVTTATKVHEAGKSWLEWAKKHAVEIYQQGLELAKQDPVGIQRAIDGGAKGEKEILESVASKYISDMGEHPLDNIPKEVWTDKLFGTAKSFIEKTTKAKLPDGFQYESMENLSGRIYNKMAQTQAAEQLTHAQTTQIESDTTMTRFQVNATVPENEFDHFMQGAGTAPTQIIIPPTFNAERGLRQGIGNVTREAIEANNPNVTPREAIKSYLSNMLGDIVKKASTGLGSENPMNKSFTLDLETAKGKLEENKFNDDFQVMADQIAENGKIDMYATDENGQGLYSKDFRKMYDNITKHFLQKANIDAMNGKVVLDQHRVIAPDYVEEKGKQEISTFHENLQKKLGNSKILKKIYDVADRHFTHNTEHLDGWAKHITGLTNGLLNNIVKGMTGWNGSTGREAVYADSFDKAVHPLYEAEWLKKGSQTLNPNAKITELETRLIAGVPVTTEESLLMFMQSQRDERTVAAWYGGAPVEGEEGAATKPGHIFSLAEIEGRDAKEVVVSYQDYKEMLAEFDPHHDEIRDTVAKGFNHLLTVVNPVFKLENGIELAPFNELEAEKENQAGLPQGLTKEETEKRWGFYFPHTKAGNESVIYDKLNRNTFINEIASHKTYSPSNEVKSSAKSFFKTIQNYRDGNAKYAAWTIPMRNVDNYLKANEATIKDLGLEHKIQWWVDYKKNVFNPPTESAIGKTGQGLMANYILSRLALNPFVSAEQMTAIPLAVTTIPAKYLFRAKSVFASSIGTDISNMSMFADRVNNDKKINATVQEMNERCPYALYRNNNGASELQRFVQTSDNKSIDVLNKGLAHLFGDKVKIDRNDLLKNIQIPDKAIGAMYWEASKMMVADEGLFENGREPSRYWARVGELYTQAITESQHSSDDAHRSMLATKHGVLAKSLSLFGSQKIAAFNGFQSRVIDYISDPSADNLKKMTTQAMNVFVTNAAMSATIQTGRFVLLGSAAAALHHKPEDVYAENFVKGMLSNVPLAAPAFDLVYGKYKSGVYGRDFSYVPFEMVTDGGKTIADGIHALTDGTKKHQAVSDLIYSVSGAAGLPLEPVLFGKSAYERLK